MRALIALSVALAACGNGGDDTGNDTGAGDTDVQEGHPLVPEKYKFIWNVDGCTTTDGKPGTQVYILSEDGRSDGAGNFSSRELWYHFKGTGNYGDDCVDEFKVTGSFAAFDYAQLGCSQCEEAYQVEHELISRTCGITYWGVFGFQDDPKLDDKYSAIVMFDTLTPSGNPNVDNAMLVIMATEVKPRTYAPDIDYARGHAFPDDAPGYPSNYDWLGDKCLGSKE